MPRVQSVGEYQDPISLVGEVKIEEGDYIEITRDDAHNSLIIKNTRPGYPQCTVAHREQGSTNKQATPRNPTFVTTVT